MTMPTQTLGCCLFAGEDSAGIAMKQQLALGFVGWQQQLLRVPPSEVRQAHVVAQVSRQGWVIPR